MLTFVLSTTMVLAVLQGAPQPAPMKLGKPVNDPVSAKGCLRGTMLTILESDSADLSGAREVKITGPRSLMKQLADYRNHYLDVVGILKREGGQNDRIEMRRRQKVGSKTTISIGTKAEQGRGELATGPPATFKLELQSFEPLSDRCPSS
jgi:hypothetical protein